jgi:hypothetical protein
MQPDRRTERGERWIVLEQYIQIIDSRKIAEIDLSNYCKPCPAFEIFKAKTMAENRGFSNT